MVVPRAWLSKREKEIRDSWIFANDEEQERALKRMANVIKREKKLFPSIDDLKGYRRGQYFCVSCDHYHYRRSFIGRKHYRRAKENDV